MDSLDREVLKAAAAWVARGLGCQLVTVVRTWGSSPRPPGALLAIAADGRVAGSVSGGCIDDDLIDRVRRDGIAAVPTLVTYGVSADEAHRFGLPCGGTIELAVEPLGPHSRLDALLKMLEGQQLVARRLDLATGEVTLAGARRDDALQLAGDILTTIHGPRWRLVLIGAGQLSRHVALIATALDYHVIVCDPREEYRAGLDLPGIEPVHAMPDDLVLELKPDARTAVVALTHDPKLDDLALMEALKSAAFYVGAMGSRVNSEKRRERLREFDLTETQLARLHGPVGIHIGSRTPPEIAVSLMAEITAIKNGVVPGRAD